MLGAGVPMSRVRPELTSIRPLAKGCRTEVCPVSDICFAEMQKRKIDFLTLIDLINQTNVERRKGLQDTVFAYKSRNQSQKAQLTAGVHSED